MEACDCLRKKYGKSCLENNDTSKNIHDALYARRVEVPWKLTPNYWSQYSRQRGELDKCFKAMAASGRLTSRNLNAHFTARHKHPTNRTRVREVAAEARAATVVHDYNQKRSKGGVGGEGATEATEVSSRTSASVIRRSMRAGEHTRNGRAPHDYEFIYVPWRRGYSMHSAKLHLNDLMRMRDENLEYDEGYDSDDSYNERNDGDGKWTTAPDPDEPTLCYTDTLVDDILPAVKWMGHDCGQQLLTGSFHPLPEGEWSTDAISAPPKSATAGGAGGKGTLAEKSSGAADSEGEGKGDDGRTRERAWPVRCRVRIECFDADDELTNKTLRKALIAAMPSLGSIVLGPTNNYFNWQRQGIQPDDMFLRNTDERRNDANAGALQKGFVPGLVLRTAATEAEAAAMMAAASGVSGATLAVESYSMESHVCFPWLGVDAVIDGHREGNGGSGIGDDGGGDHAMPTASLAKSQASQRQVCARCSAALLVPNRCKRCFQVSYCNRECQRKHWKRHRDQCRKDSQSAVKTPVAAGGSD